MAKQKPDDDDEDRDEPPATTRTAAGASAATKPADPTPGQKRNKGIKVALEKVRSVVFLPITEDAEGKKNAKSIRDAMAELEKALELPK